MDNLNPYTYYNLWATPIWRTEDPEYNTRRDGLIEECMEYYNGQDNIHEAQVVKSRMYESPFNFFDVARERNYENLMYIEKLMETQFKAIFKNFFTSNNYFDSEQKPFIPDDIHINTAESWVHISTGPGSYHGDHNHPRTSWGGIYYIDVNDVGGENGGVNQFKQPFDTMYYDLGNFFQQDNTIFEVTPMNGKIVFFPANIMHNATPYFGNGRRIVVASNLRVYHPKDDRLLK